jgi:hypothetical protein
MPTGAPLSRPSIYLHVDCVSAYGPVHGVLYSRGSLSLRIPFFLFCFKFVGGGRLIA